MKMPRPSRWILASILATSLVFSLPSCSDAPTSGPEGQTTLDTEGVVFVDPATDEALLALLGATPKNDASQSVVVDTPAEGVVLAKDTPPTVTWHVGTGMGATLRALGLWLSPRSAWAHGAPLYGRAYLLVFSTPSNPKVLRIFTTNLDYAFDDATWSTLSGVQGLVTLTITNAIFDANRIAADGGPFVGEPRSFSMEP